MGQKILPILYILLAPPYLKPDLRRLKYGYKCIRISRANKRLGSREAIG